MFDIGFWEVVLIGMLALIVIGPERLPGVARTLGHWVGRARRYVEGVKSEVEKELDTTELKRILHNQEVQIRELQGKLNSDTQRLFDSSANKTATTQEPQYEIIEEKDYSADAATNIEPVTTVDTHPDTSGISKDKPA